MFLPGGHFILGGECHSRKGVADPGPPFRGHFSLFILKEEISAEILADFGHQARPLSNFGPPRNLLEFRAREI